MIQNYCSSYKKWNDSGIVYIIRAFWRCVVHAVASKCSYYAHIWTIKYIRLASILLIQYIISAILPQATIWKQSFEMSKKNPDPLKSLSQCSSALSACWIVLVFIFKAWILNNERKKFLRPILFELCPRLFGIISFPLGGLFRVLSLAHFGLSLCIHVFVYIMRHAAASLDESQLFWTPSCMIHE